MELGMIQKRIAMLEKEEEVIKKANEMIKTELENNIEYQQVLAEAKEANRKKKNIKDGILAQDTFVQLQLEINEAMEEIKTLREILSAELILWYQKNNTDEITDMNGESRKFKVNVRLVPKKAGNWQERSEMGQYTEMPTKPEPPKSQPVAPTIEQAVE